MKQGSNGEASRNAGEKREQHRSPETGMRDPRARQWGMSNNQTQKLQMSHAPKRDMTGKRRDIDK